MQCYHDGDAAQHGQGFGQCFNVACPWRKIGHRRPLALTSCSPDVRSNCNELACVRSLEGKLLHLHFLVIRDITLGRCGRGPCQNTEFYSRKCGTVHCGLP